VDEGDQLDQCFISKAAGEWRKRLQTCVVVEEKQFEHMM